MADLAAALDALAPAKPGPPCGVGTYLERLAARDAALHARVVALIDDAAVRGADLARALEADGAGISAYALRHHRKRGTANGCRCSR